jgi:hydrogenase-4 component E
MQPLEFLAIAAAIFAVLMAGSGTLRLNLRLYALQTVCIAFATIAAAQQEAPDLAFNGMLTASAIIGLKALGVPYFLERIIKKIDVRSDPGTMLPIPLSMHVSIAFLALSQFIAQSLPHPAGLPGTIGGATAAISLVFTGILFMLTRRVALSQVIGFLTMENGIYLFAMDQTQGMPMIVEMGMLLDVLVAVMIAGLIVFRIKKSFEHIDVTQLTDLKEQ